MILLPCPVRPDLDCVAGALAYAEYLQRTRNILAKAWLCGIPDGEAGFYLDTFKDKLIFATPEEIEKASSYILVDFSTFGFIPDAPDREKVIEVIDHRFFNDPEKEFPNARVQLDQVGAAATQIAEFFMRDTMVPSAEISTLLYSAIYSHTLCCQGDMFDKRDQVALDWLKTVNPKADALLAGQFDARKNEILKSFPEILKTEMKMENAAFGQYGISQLEMMDAAGLWNEKRAEIKAYFSQQFKHPVFLNLIDLSTNSSTFYFSDESFGDLMDNHADIIMRDDHSVCFRPAFMRKQIIPLINNSPTKPVF